MCDNISFFFLLVAVNSGFIFQGASKELCTPRPFFNIAHMQNSLGELYEALENGANAVEVDVHFKNNGTVERLYHGTPCDCLRACQKHEDFATYLDRVQELTTPSHPDYKKNFLLIFFDLKSTRLEPDVKYSAGEDLASKLIYHLWDGGKGVCKIRIVVYVESYRESNVILGLREFFLKKGFSDLLTRIGFEIGADIGGHEDAALQRIGIKDRVWKGDGITNCLSYFSSSSRLMQFLKQRDNTQSKVNKVYKWTIDFTYQMRETIRMGVDGMITNHPERIVHILEEQEFKCLARLATSEVNPLKKFTPLHNMMNYRLEHHNDYLSTFEDLAGSLYHYFHSNDNKTSG